MSHRLLRLGRGEFDGKLWKYHTRVSSYEPNFLDVRLDSRLSLEGVYIRVKGDVWGIWVPLGSFADVQNAQHPLHQSFSPRRLCDLSRH